MSTFNNNNTNKMVYLFICLFVELLKHNNIIPLQYISKKIKHHKNISDIVKTTSNAVQGNCIKRLKAKIAGCMECRMTNTEQCYNQFTIPWDSSDFANLRVKHV